MDEWAVDGWTDLMMPLGGGGGLSKSDIQKLLLKEVFHVLHVI